MNDRTLELSLAANPLRSLLVCHPRRFGRWESGNARDGIDAANAVRTAIAAIQGMPDLPDGSRPYGLEDPRT